MKKAVIVFAVVAMMTSCIHKDQQTFVKDDIQIATIDSMKTVFFKQHIIDSMKIAYETEKKQQLTKEVVVVNNQQPVATPPANKIRKQWNGAEKGEDIGAMNTKKKAERTLIGDFGGDAITDGSKK